MGQLSVYNVSYRSFDKNMEPHEEFVEVWAYSEEQAIYLSPCNPGQILYVERAVSKKTAFA